MTKPNRHHTRADELTLGTPIPIGRDVNKIVEKAIPHGERHYLPALLFKLLGRPHWAVTNLVFLAFSDATSTTVRASRLFPTEPKTSGRTRFAS